MQRWPVHALRQEGRGDPKARLMILDHKGLLRNPEKGRMRIALYGAHRMLKAGLACRAYPSAV